MRIDELEPIVLAIHERHPAAERSAKSIACIEHRGDQRVGLVPGRKNAAPAAVARGECGVVFIARADDGGNARHPECAEQVEVGLEKDRRPR